MKEDLKVEDLVDYLNKETIQYARTPTKKLLIKLNGSFEVWTIVDKDDLSKGGKCVYHGVQPYSAIEVYNELPD